MGKFFDADDGSDVRFEVLILFDIFLQFLIEMRFEIVGVDFD